MLVTREVPQRIEDRLIVALDVPSIGGARTLVSMNAAIEVRGNSRLKVLAITVLTSVDQKGLRDIGYLCSVEELVGPRVERALACGCDGIIAAPHDNSDELRRRAGGKAADRDPERKTGRVIG